MKRRAFLVLCGGSVSLFGVGGVPWKGRAVVSNNGVNLLSAPLDVHGDWGGSPRTDVAAVISRVREACLSGLRLLSDRQPDQIRVDDQTSGPPHVWLHADNPTTAWIVVDIGTLAWSQLAYQFGHELGHIMCNSWMWKVETPPPSRWLEECLAEAFSLRGLGRLADEWERNPPFPHDARYGNALRGYRRDLIEKYQKAAGPGPTEDLGKWFRANRDLLNGATGLSAYAGPAVLAALKEMEADKGCVEDFGAVNRWPERSAVPIEEYLRLWRMSCGQIETPGRLPARFQEIFSLGTASSGRP